MVKNMPIESSWNRINELFVPGLPVSDQPPIPDCILNNIVIVAKYGIESVYAIMASENE
jgi:hypothetical protein